jgi:hypothetical protein
MQAAGVRNPPQESKVNDPGFKVSQGKTRLFGIQENLEDEITSNPHSRGLNKRSPKKNGYL